MRSLRRPRLLAVLTFALIAATPAAASAAVSQESMLQDDNSLIFNTPAGTAKTLDTLAELGVDRVRVSVFWATVAPSPQSQTRPQFTATNPAAYPSGSWDRYDQVVRLAHARGIAVNFNITSPAPLWATGDDSPRTDILDTWKPDPKEFADFVQAVGTRYGGNYGAPGGSFPQPVHPPLCDLTGTCPPDEPQPPVLKDGPLPRVDYFSIWNEPNQPGWLTPQWEARPDGQPGMVEAAPRIYRGLVDAAFRGLRASGHGDDTILIGETAPKGVSKQGPTTAIAALRFIRQVYCVDDALQPLRGAEAAARDCPQDDAGTAAFADAHPGLFVASGYAHHPYELSASPKKQPSNGDFITIANLPKLTLALRSIFTVYGRANGLPLYLTEFGYNTRPPNPLGVTASQQAAYLNQAQYMASTNPSVRALTQFLLVDDATKAPGPGYAATFQTGLEYLGGRRKPSFDAYQLTLHLPTAKIKRGGKLLVWGLVRPASRLGPQKLSIQQRRSNGSYQTLKRLGTLYGRGVVSTRVKITRSGSLRLAWRDPRDKQVVHSRAIKVVAKR
jgi:hypothetical protein